MSDGYAVVEPLRVRSVRRWGRRVRVVVTGRAGAVHAITFRLESVVLARGVRAQVMEWLTHQTHVAYVRGGDAGALIDVEELLARAQC